MENLKKTKPKPGPKGNKKTLEENLRKTVGKQQKTLGIDNLRKT